MKKMFIIMVLVASLLVASCASNNGPKVATPDNIVNQDSQNTIKLNVKDQAQDQIKEQTQDQEQTQKEDLKKEFEDIVTKGESLEFKVNYKLTNNYVNQVEELKSVWYMKKGKFRMDTLGVVEGQAYESRMITTQNSAVLCNKDTKWSCFDMGLSPKEAMENQDAQAELMTTKDFDPDMMVTSAPDRTIAGTTATCFKVSLEKVSSEFCYSKEGVPLYYETNADDIKMVQEATSYSTSVSDSEFEPPAPLMDIGDMMAQLNTN